MPTTASSDLITALKASLADGSAAWQVEAVNESTSSSATYNLERAGPDDYALNGGEVVYLNTTVVLVSGAVRLLVGSRATMRLIYLSVKVNGSFSFATITWNGRQFKSTDSALNTTVLNMASTFVSNSDATLTAALNAGPVDDPLLISDDLLTAIKASLAGTEAGWKVRTRAENVVDSTLVPVRIQVSIVLNSTAGVVTVVDSNDVSHKIPTTISYIYTTDAAGTLLEGRLLMDSAQWRTRDSALFSTIKTMGDDWLDTQATTLTSELDDVG